MEQSHVEELEKVVKKEVSNDTDPMSKDLPKRVLIFTSEKLLKQLTKNKKTSVDGTFKSSCRLWKQLFVWMIKQNGYWTPVVWGWLPDNTEESYKIFVLSTLNEPSLTKGPRKEK